MPSPKKKKKNKRKNEEQIQNITKDTEKVESINGKGRCGTMKGSFERKNDEKTIASLSF